MRLYPCRRTASCSSRGFTLTEVAIVVGIVGVMLGGIWVAASKVYANRQITRASQQVLTLSSGLAALYSNGNIQAGAQKLSPLAVNNAIVTPDMVGACPSGSSWGSSYGGTAGCALSPWGTEVFAGTQYAWGGLPSQSNLFEIGIEGLTASQCASFLATFVPQAANDKLVQVAAQNGLSATAVTSSTAASVFTKCSGTVYLQFQLN